MTLAETLVSVWSQALVELKAEIEVNGKVLRVDHTRGKRLRVVGFTYSGTVIEGIEQNPETASRWAKMAQEGQRIMQFRAGGRYFANVAEGRLTRYPSWTSLRLPE